jgi:hypothetical protein
MFLPKFTEPTEQKRTSIELTSKPVILTNRRIISLNYTSVSELPPIAMLMCRIERALASTYVAEVTDNHLPKLYIKTSDVRRLFPEKTQPLKKLTDLLWFYSPLSVSNCGPTNET